MSTQRWRLNLSESDIELFETERIKAGMYKNDFMKLLLANYCNAAPGFIKYKDVINKISELNNLIKRLLLLDKVDDSGKMIIIEKLEMLSDELRKLK